MITCALSAPSAFPDLVTESAAAGDWKLFPRVVRDFAKGLFRVEDGVLCYGGEPVSAVWYPDGAAPRPCEEYMFMSSQQRVCDSGDVMIDQSPFLKKE